MELIGRMNAASEQGRFLRQAVLLSVALFPEA